MASFPSRLRDITGGLMLGTLVLAPLLYGATSWRMEKLLAEMLGVTFVFWLLSQVTGKVRFKVDGPAIALLYLFLCGWGMALNAHGLYDVNYRSFFPLTGFFSSAPGSIDKLSSINGMERMTGLMAAFLIARSLGAEAKWRRRFTVTLALAGVVVAIVGLILKLGGAALTALVWPQDLYSRNSFAFFLYHANAGAYLNLAWPLALACGLNAVVENKPSWQKGYWAIAVFLILLSVQINFSKAAMVIALVLFALFSLQIIRQSTPSLRKRKALFLIVFLLANGAVAAALSPFTHGTAWKRWEDLKVPVQRERSIGWRLEIQQISLAMARNAGWWGSGPETFAAGFAGYQDRIHRPPGIYDEAHQDYLQTVIEWGIGGTLAWSYLALGGIRRIWKRMTEARRLGPPWEFWNEYAILLALLGVFLHAGCDFPLEIDSIRLDVLVLLALGWAIGSRRAAE